MLHVHRYTYAIMTFNELNHFDSLHMHILYSMSCAQKLKISPLQFVTCQNFVPTCTNTNLPSNLAKFPFQAMDYIVHVGQKIELAEKIHASRG